MTESWLYDVEKVKNRPDKSVVEIHSMYPELLLSSVSTPKLVKHLKLNLYFEYGSSYDSDHQKHRGRFCSCIGSQSCTRCVWVNIYNDKLCKDIIHFTNLVTVEFIDVNLDTRLWVQFAQNSNCLENVFFVSYDEWGCDRFDFSDKMEALEAIVKIPTLKYIEFDRVHLESFPQGPSNIEELHIICMNEKIKFDLSSHKNLKSVTLDRFSCKFSEMHLEKLEDLEELNFVSKYVDQDFYIKDGEDLKSLRSILNAPKFVKLNDTIISKPVSEEDVEKVKIDLNL
jgi:hypothetical protein